MSKDIKPDYYKSATEQDIIDLGYEFNLPFDVFNVWKYTFRAGKKHSDKEIEDLDKAIEYLERRKKHLLGKK